jgi:hypothetical protein
MVERLFVLKPQMEYSGPLTYPVFVSFVSGGQTVGTTKTRQHYLN